MPSAQIAFVTDDKLDVLVDDIDTVGQLNQPRSGPARKTRIDFHYDWATLRPSEFNVRWPPAKAESPQATQRNVCNTLMLLISQWGRKHALARDEIGWAVEVGGTNRNDHVSHRSSVIEWALCEFFDQYSRRRPTFVRPPQQIGRMLGQLIHIPAQSDSAAAAAFGWLKYHRQADLCDRAFDLLRSCCQSVSRHWNAGLRKELTLSKFIATSFNRCGGWSR
ncbi:hypothetical protein X766_33920 [Mesorhizobium sp. LSJC255A00]|nr:hypothetical protein X766_33920 [Mesorhizobium sp. LSJC255A00]